jgi:predicted amidohydrolase YtcJ
MDLNPDLINIYKELSEAEKLNIRIFSFVKAQDDEYIKYKIKPYCSDFFSIVGIKLYVDGALGSRGAALLAPYSDEPRNKGLLLLKEKELYEKIDKAIGHDLQVAVHAIGDRANRTVLKTFNKILEKHYEKHNLYFRIEHAQIIHPDDFCYLSDGRIICSVQPIHCISDSEMAIKRLGQRCKYAYLWKSLLNQNINILGGSDFPIESHNPILGIDAFVNRIENNTISIWY